MAESEEGSDVYIYIYIFFFFPPRLLTVVVHVDSVGHSSFC